MPNLLHFAADAYLNEMGITTPLFPDENCPQGNCMLLACDPVPGVDDDLEDVDKFRDFTTYAYRHHQALHFSAWRVGNFATLRGSFVLSPISEPCGDGFFDLGRLSVRERRSA